MKRVWLSLACVTVACGGNKTATPEPAAVVDSGPPVPARVCNTPVPPSDPWFTEITNEVGLGKTGTLEPVATSVVSADLDGDGHLDLIAAFFPAQREPEGAPRRTRFVFMSRPSPSEPNKRIFVDETYASGLLATRDGVGGRGFSIVTLGDLDNDGDVDVIACPGSTEKEVLDTCAAFANDGKGHFTLFPASELDQMFWTTGGALLDFDRDGILDFFPSVVGVWPGAVTSAPRLYKGNGDGTFRNVALEVGLPKGKRDSTTGNDRRSFGVTACDVDGDGDVDLLVANYGRDANYLYRNDGGKFVEVGESLGVAFDEQQSFTDDNSYRCYCRDNPGACPADVPKPAAGLGCRGWVPGYSDSKYHLGGNTFSIACADVDDDGDMDLVTAEIRHSDVGSASDPSEILINPMKPGGPLEKFVRPGNVKMGIHRAHTASYWDEGDNVPLLADIDLDGRKDLYLTSSNYPGTHPWLFHQKQDGTFEDVTAVSHADPKSGEGPALIDLDGDGDLDLVIGTGTFNMAAPANTLRAYRNEIGQSSNWTRIRIVGKGAGHSNASGIGARVIVRAGGRQQMQEVQGGWGHSVVLGDHALTFGLGATCDIDEIEVRWPDAANTVSKYKAVRANYPITIVEGEPAPRYPSK